MKRFFVLYTSCEHGGGEKLQLPAAICRGQKCLALHFWTFTFHKNPIF